MNGKKQEKAYLKEKGHVIRLNDELVGVRVDNRLGDHIQDQLQKVNAINNRGFDGVERKEIVRIHVED